VRQEVETAARWTAFTDELRTMIAAAVQADHVRPQSVNLAALRTYNICRQLARDRTRAPQVGAQSFLEVCAEARGLRIGSGRGASRQVTTAVRTHESG
jgi:hypothetical protein